MAIDEMVVKWSMDSSNFNSGLTSLNNNMKVLESGFKAASEKLKGFGSTTDQMRNKSDYLNKAIELQKSKVDVLSKTYEKTKTETGKFSNETMTAANKVNNAVTYLAKLENELKKVDSELNKTSNTSKKMDLKSNFEKASSGVTGMQSKLNTLKNAFLGISATVAGGFGLFKFTEGAINAGNNAYILSQKLHITSKEASELNRVLTITGTDTKPVITTLTKLDKAIEGAGTKGNATTKMLKEYGVVLTDTNGKLLPMNTQLDQLAAAYKKASDAGEEEAFSAEVLGTKGAELIPLLENYTSAKEAASKVVGIGIDPAEAHEAEESLKVLKLQVSATGGVVAKSLLPVVQSVLPPLVELFQKIATKVKENKVELDKFIASAINIGKQLAEIIAPMVKGLFSFIVEHGEASKNIIIGLGTAFIGLKAAKTTIDGLTTAMDMWDGAMKIKDKISDMVEIMKKWSIVTKFQAIAQAALNFVMSLNPITLIIIGITALVAGIVLLWNKCEWFRNGVTSVFEWIKGVFTTFSSFLTSAFATDWTSSFGVFGNILNAFFANISNIFDGVKRIFGGIIDFVTGVFSGNWSQAWQGVVDIFGGIFDTLGGILKAPLNGVIGLINMAIDGLNSISIDIPDWVPGGGGHFGVDLPKIDYLYNGGIIDRPTNIGGNTVVGDSYKGLGRQAEAVIPLDSMYRNLRNIVKEESSSQPFIIYTTNITTLDGKEIARETKKEVIKDITRGQKSRNIGLGYA